MKNFTIDKREIDFIIKEYNKKFKEECIDEFNFIDKGTFTFSFEEKDEEINIGWECYIKTDKYASKIILSSEYDYTCLIKSGIYKYFNMLLEQARRSILKIQGKEI